MMMDKKIRRLALGGMLSALIFLLTYLFKIQIGPVGYVHLGDGAIFLAAVLIGPYAALAAGVGSALADLLGGYAAYIIPTFIIKAAMGGIAGLLSRKQKPLRNIFAFVLAESVMVAGYFVFEGFFYYWADAYAGIGPNLLQGAAGVVMGSLLTALPLSRLEGI